MDPRPLEHVETDDLIDELKARSRVLFLAMRTLAVKGQDSIYVLSVDGKPHTDTDEERDRCIGLAQRAQKVVYEAE